MATMDLDMSLDDLAARSRKPSAPRGGRRSGPPGGRGGGRRDDRGGRSAPYARPPPGDIEGQWKHDLNPDSRRSERAAGGPRPPPPGQRPNKIIVENLHYEITEQELMNLFAGYTVVNLSLKYDRSGRSMGVAYVTFSDPSDVDRAIESFDGQAAKQQVISVKQNGWAPLDAAGKGAAGGTGRAPPSGPSGGSGGSLLARLGPPNISLLDRLSAPAKSSSGPRVPRNDGSSRPSRGAGGASGGRGGRYGRAGGERRKPATADDLDKELEDFMKQDAGKDDSAAATVATTGDVEMS